MKQTLMELYEKSRLAVPAIPAIPNGGKTASNTEEVKLPRVLGRTLALNEATYHQVERVGKIAIYEGPKTGVFQVIVIQTKPRGVCPSGAVVPWREVYPVAEQWGTYAWTFTSASHREPLAAARDRVKALLAGGQGYAAI
jgi:hypothetical protein